MHRFFHLLNGSRRHLIPGMFFFIYGFLMTRRCSTIHRSFPFGESVAGFLDSSSGRIPTGYGVYLFRKLMDLNNKPDSFVIHVSADNRYKLFVNEQQVSLGPARGDLDHWNFATLDIAPFLHAGKNIIAAQVWNEGEWRPEGQISLRTGFILQGSDQHEKKINYRQ